MKLLVLGGTEFLGRAVVEAALAAGDEVTLFNRGVTNPGLFPEAEHLRGDRDGDLAALAGREWDAVIDPSGFVPRIVRDSAELLRDAVGHYVFVSSISVYGVSQPPRWDEATPRLELSEPSEDPREHYGELKADCEDVVREVFAARAANVRAGLIVGPHDPTGRFTYWPHRIARGGRVLAPGDPEREVQFIDVRDLGAWLLHLARERIGGDFNATGPREQLTMGGLLAGCIAANGSDAELVWAPEQFLVEHEVGEWMDMPLWLLPENSAMLQVDVGRALGAGLTCRPLAETVAATLAEAKPAEGVGLTPEREAELLAAIRV